MRQNRLERLTSPGLPPMAAFGPIGPVTANCSRNRSVRRRQSVPVSGRIRGVTREQRAESPGDTSSGSPRNTWKG